MRAFVAGATGYTGREVIRELGRRGIETMAHIRPDSPRIDEWRTYFSRLGAKPDATPWSGAAMTETIGRLEPQLVFALLGTTRARGRAARRAGGAVETYDTVDYGLTSLLISAVRDAAPSARFVYLSSIGVRDNSRNSYLQARAKVERELRSSGLAWVIARPSIISGPDRDERRPAERMAALVADGLLRFAAVLGARSLRRRFGSTTNAELGRALVRLGLDRERVGVIAEAERLRDPE